MIFLSKTSKSMRYLCLHDFIIIVSTPCDNVSKSTPVYKFLAKVLRHTACRHDNFSLNITNVLVFTVIDVLEWCFYSFFRCLTRSSLACAVKTFFNRGGKCEGYFCNFGSRNLKGFNVRFHTHCLTLFDK